MIVVIMVWEGKRFLTTEVEAGSVNEAWAVMMDDHRKRIKNLARMEYERQIRDADEQFYMTGKRKNVDSPAMIESEYKTNLRRFPVKIRIVHNKKLGLSNDHKNIWRNP